MKRYSVVIYTGKLSDNTYLRATVLKDGTYSFNTLEETTFDTREEAEEALSCADEWAKANADIEEIEVEDD